MPKTPENIINSIGEIGFLTIYLYNIAVKPTALKIIKLFQLKMNVELIVVKFKIVVKKIEIEVAIINPIKTGLMPFRTALNAGYLVKFLKKWAINIMIIKHGRTTPNVATIAPKTPA